MKTLGNTTAKVMNDLAKNIDVDMSDAVGGDKADFKTPPAVSNHVEAVLSDIDAQQADSLVNKHPDGNTLLSTEDYKGFSPDIKISGRGDGLTSSSVSRPTVMDSSGAPDARPANATDLSKLDESSIMNMPFIKPSSNIVPDILFLKPKDPGIRFRWVNFKNYEGGNYAKYKAYGFSNASIDDIDISRTPVDSNCVNGTEIKWYDVILMKIPVMKLMSLYKQNIIASLKRVGRFQEDSLTMAQKTFNDSLHNEVNAKTGEPLINALNRARREGHDVNFYVPGLEEITEQQPGFLS